MVPSSAMRAGLLCLVFLLSPTLGAAEVQVLAAASLTDALSEIGARYTTETGVTVRFNFGGSSTLARQIAEGAPADVFLSADEEKMDRLQESGLIEARTRVSILSNRLVIITAADSPFRIRSALDLRQDAIRRIAIAEPQTVPAGIYAREYLQKVGLWPAIATKIIPTENVRAALAAVEAQNADAAIVYKSDAAISPRVRVRYEIPGAETPGISYAFAVLAEAKNPTAGRRFLEFLASRSALDVFAKHGFIVRGR